MVFLGDFKVFNGFYCCVVVVFLRCLRFFLRFSWGFGWEVFICLLVLLWWFSLVVVVLLFPFWFCCRGGWFRFLLVPFHPPCKERVVLWFCWCFFQLFLFFFCSVFSGSLTLACWFMSYLRGFGPKAAPRLLPIENLGTSIKQWWKPLFLMISWWHWFVL